MKRTLWLAAAAATLHATTIHELFDALKKHPTTRADAMRAEYAKLSARRVTDAFYPTVSLFATYEHYNAPTNLRPMSPVESITMRQKKEALPFATTIERLGGKVSMPLFAKDLFSLSDKARAMAQSAEAEKRLDLLRNEALLLGAYANWRYLESLEAAMKARRRSIQKMLDDVRIKVQNGRAPGIVLDKMAEAYNRIDIALNDIGIKKAQTMGRIESLTGLRIGRAAALKRKRAVQTGEIFAAKPLEYMVSAKAHGVDAAYGKLYPKVGLSAVWSENYGQNAVNYQGIDGGDDVHRSYGNYMVGLSMPLFDKGAYTDIERARVDLQKERFELARTKQALEAEARELKTSRNLYERSIILAKKSVKNRESLLEYAKVAFETGRLSEEEYLRYEEGLLEAQSKRYEAEAKKWQVIAQLAVIYGNDLDEIVE